MPNVNLIPHFEKGFRERQKWQHTLNIDNIAYNELTCCMSTVAWWNVGDTSTFCGVQNYFEGVKNSCVQQINIKLIISEGNYFKKSKNWPFFD